MGFAKRQHDYEGDYGYLVFNGSPLPHFDANGDYCSHEKGCKHELVELEDQQERGVSPKGE